MLQAVPYLGPRFRGDDGRPRTIVIPAKAGIQGLGGLLPRNHWG
jgi:hypothetical protein